MKLIKDLGTDKSKGYRRYGIYECPECLVNHKHSTTDVKKSKIVLCKLCSSKQKAAKRKTHGESGSKLWNVWSHMNDRCSNDKSKSYKDYGGRGISVCNEWQHKAKVFIDWARNNGYQEGLTIDRIRNDGNYEPNNCQWVTMKGQCSNRRRKYNATSKHNGISWKEANKKWQCQYKGKYIGLFDSETEAKEAWEYKDRQLFDED